MSEQTNAAAAEDTRIVYGAVCTWWGRIHETKTNVAGLPVCPHCKGVLFELPSPDLFNAGVKQFAEANKDPDYPAFVEWLRSCGRCWRDWKIARGVFEDSKGAVS